MKIITHQEIRNNQELYVQEIKNGKIFVYPTDTIYGIGCDATNTSSVLKIREIKQRDSKPMSVIVPSKEWIVSHCTISQEQEEEIDKLPGPFTFILELKKHDDFAKEALVGSLKGIGVRIPTHWFTKFLQQNNILFVTTSVNISGEAPLTNPKSISTKMQERIDYLIDDGVLEQKASTVIDLRTKTVLRK